jgi:hypothetical protein
MATQAETQEEYIKQLESELEWSNGRGMSEAGFSMNFGMISDLAGPCQVTFRGSTCKDWPEVSGQASEFVKAKLAQGWKFNVPAPAPKQSESAPQAAPTSAPAQPSAGVAVTEVRVVYMEVLPQADGKTEVKFFGNDKKQPHNQYPDVYSKRMAQDHVKAMPFLDPNIFGRAGNYAVSLVLGYTLSAKTNAKGNPYKDVQYIKQA